MPTKKSGGSKAVVKPSKVVDESNDTPETLIIKRIGEALRDAADVGHAVPGGVENLEMLVTCMQIPLLRYVDERNAWDRTMLECVSDALSSVVSGLLADLREETHTLATGDEVSGRYQQDLVALEQVIEVKQKFLDEQKVQLESATHAADQAKEALKEAKKIVAKLETHAKKADAEIANHTENIEVDFAVLKTAEKRMKPKSSQVTRIMARLENADASLLVAAFSTLTKSAQERGEFDSIVMNSIEEHLKEQLQILLNQRAEDQILLEQQTNHMREAAASVEQVEEVRQTWLKATKDATADHKAAQQDFNAKNKQISDHAYRLETGAERISVLEGHVADYQDVHKAFSELLNRREPLCTDLPYQEESVPDAVMEDSLSGTDMFSGVYPMEVDTGLTA